MSTKACPYWEEYASPAGTVCFCRAAAYNAEPTWEELEAIGCYQRRQECRLKMEMTVGTAALPAPHGTLQAGYRTA